MKRLITLSVLLVIGHFSYAQLTQANHAPAIGDAYSTYQCGDTLTISLVGSGANVNWDYSTITTHSSIIKNYTGSAPSSSVFSSANVLMSSGPTNNSYYSSSAANLLYHGGNVNAGAVSGEFIYSTPMLSAAYPMNLNSISTSTTAGSLNMTVPLTLSGTFTGSASVLVDATGSLTLPGPVTFTNVTRVITSQTIAFVTSLAPGTLYQVNFEYFGGGLKGPLFTISTTTAVTPLGTFPQTVITRQALGSVTVSLPESLLQASDIELYPNPVKENLTVNFESDEKVNFNVYNFQGQLMVENSLHIGNNSISTEKLKPGLYFYAVFDADGRVLKRDKLIKD